MPPKEKQELQVFSLDNLNPALLPELATFKQSQLQVVQDNPFIVITDTASRDLAKKYRTARVSARTALQAQDKLISSKFNDAKTKAKSYIAELIDISLPGEKLQQEEIDRDEAEAEAKRQEKARLEQLRIDNIKRELEDYVAQWKVAFNIMSFESIEKVSADFLESYTTYDLTVLEEFDALFPAKIEELTQYLSNKTYSLTEAENARLEKERIEAESKKLAEEKAEFEAKQKAIEAENQRKQNEIIAEQNRIAAENFKISQENERKSKELAEAIAKLDADKKQKEQEEADKLAELNAKEISAPVESTVNVCYDLPKDIYPGIREGKIYKGNVLLDIVEPDSTGINHLSILSQESIEHLLKSTVSVCNSLDDETSDGYTKVGIVEHMFPKSTPKWIPEEEIETPFHYWDSIAEDFKNSGGKSYSKWLKDNYNVPTKIQ